MLGWLSSLHALFSKCFFPPFPLGVGFNDPTTPCVHSLIFFFSLCRYVLRTYYVLDIGKSQEIQRWHPMLPLGPVAAVKQCILSFPCSLPVWLLMLEAEFWETLSESRALLRSSLLGGRNSNVVTAEGFWMMGRCAKKRDWWAHVNLFFCFLAWVQAPRV